MSDLVLAPISVGLPFRNCPAFVRLLRSVSLRKQANSNASEHSRRRPLASHPGDHTCHLPDRGGFAHVVTARELVDKATEMLGTDLVKCTLAAALEHRPVPAEEGAHRNVPQAVPEGITRYVREFAGRPNMRTLNTLREIEAVCRALEGKRLTYKALIKNNGPRSGKGTGMLAARAMRAGPTAIRQGI